MKYWHTKARHIAWFVGLLSTMKFIFVVLMVLVVVELGRCWNPYSVYYPARQVEKPKQRGKVGDDAYI